MLKYLIRYEIKMKLKQWRNIFLVIANASSLVEHVIHLKNGLIKHANVKNYLKCEKDHSWNPSACIYENSKFLKRFTDTSVVACDGIISVMEVVSKKKANTIVKNVTKNC